MDTLFKRKITFNGIFLLLLALLFSTVLRLSLIPLFPFLVLLIAHLYNFKISKAFLILVILLSVNFFLSFRSGFYLKYNLVSLFYFIPFVFLFSTKISESSAFPNLVKPFISCLVFFAVINNIFGIFQYFTNPYDDSFRGIYGGFTVTQNGLSLLNSILFFYYFLTFTNSGRKVHLIASLFFVFCAILAFYGAGLIVLFIAIAVFYIKLRLKSVFKLLILVIFLGAIAYFLMKIISPNTLDYNLAILSKFWNASIGNAPRKLIVFYNYAVNYPENFLDLFFGSGPGTFNSRSAFMVGSPSYFSVEFIKADSQPYYFKNFAYSLWNASNTGRYDGFMNQPFSSLLAILGEYGLIFALLFFAMISRQYSAIKKIMRDKNASLEQITAGRLFQFLVIFTLLLLVIDNYMEYPEVMGVLLILIKFSEYEARSKASIGHEM